VVWLWYDRIPSVPTRPMNVGVELQRSAPLRLPPNPDRPVNESWRGWALRQTRPRAIDLFAGSGGLSLGLEDAGYRVILSVDNDPWSLETHRHNFAAPALDIDLSDAERVEGLIALVKGIPIDLVAGGPPCQPFSRAGRSKIRSLVAEGRRAATDHRRELWRSFLRVVEGVRPRAVLMENVPDMALGDDLRALRTMLTRLEQAGYAAEAALVETHRHGVPQHRERLILIGVRDGGTFRWPAMARRVTLRQAIGDLPALGNSHGELSMRYGRARTAFQRRARAGLTDRVVWDHLTRPVRDDDREAFNLMTPETRYGDLPEHLRRYRADIFNDKYHRLGWDQLSRSITAHLAKDGYWYIHPAEARTLTVREAARIQTFPDRFRFAGSRSHQFRQIGNAVPPLLAESLGRSLLTCTHEARPGGTRSERQHQVRIALIKWARENAREMPWRHPGQPWSVVVGTLLDPRPPAGTNLVRAFLAEFPSADSISAQRLRRFGATQPAAVQHRLRRLRRAAGALAADPSGNTDWLPASGLGDAEAALVEAIGLARDTVLVTRATLRVAARLNRTTVDERRAFSAGRMEVGQLVGGGPDVPIVNAALHALGSMICRPDTPRCRDCPLRHVCLSARSTVGRSDASRHAIAG
jgi:DNA (cytosine-5)-methyltransferase 1